MISRRSDTFCLIYNFCSVQSGYRNPVEMVSSVLLFQKREIVNYNQIFYINIFYILKYNLQTKLVKKSKIVKL